MVKVIRKALSYNIIDFSIIETIRNYERQQELFSQRFSHTLKSKHLPNKNGLSEAVDIIPYTAVVNGVNIWLNRERFARLAGVVQSATSDLNIKIRYGGDWDNVGNNKDSRLHDMPHFQLAK
jgi:peptidoglycan L-alanyl-D-glutamate endopeptidase CwlK